MPKPVMTLAAMTLTLTLATLMIGLIHTELDAPVKSPLNGTMEFAVSEWPTIPKSLEFEC